MITKKCVQCGKEFSLSDGEVDFYIKKGLSIPKRCESCRKINKGESGVFSSRKPAISKGNRAKISIISLIILLLIGIGVDKISGNNIFSIHDTKTVQNYEYDKQNSSFNDYTFRTSKQLTSHFQKHGSEVGAKSEFEYVDMANAVINNPAALHKTESEDGDSVYFLNSTGEIVFVSTDGFIRTYFISDYDYFNRQ